MILEKIVIGIAIFVSYFLQTSVDFFALGSVKPDFLLILTVYFALYRGSFAALWIGSPGHVQNSTPSIRSIRRKPSLAHLRRSPSASCL